MLLLNTGSEAGTFPSMQQAEGMETQVTSPPHSYTTRRQKGIAHIHAQRECMFLECGGNSYEGGENRDQIHTQRDVLDVRPEYQLSIIFNAVSPCLCGYKIVDN